MKKLISILFIIHFTLHIAPPFASRFFGKDCLCQWVQNSYLIDTVNIKYFPLTVGNVYKYHYAASNGYNYYYKLRIVKDTIINSKKYFIANRLFPGYIGQVLRCDSVTGNIYYRSSSGYCSYSPYEELIDSLRAKKRDTTLVCTPFVPKHICRDTGYVTIIGNYIKFKVFDRNTSETTTTVTYGYNFGIISAMYSDFWGLAGESLVGCYINGVLFGDTNLTDINKISEIIPNLYSLGQNYPNPFNSVSKIKFSIPENGIPMNRDAESGKWKTGNGIVSLKVYNITGKEVAVLVNEKLSAGIYEVNFDASNLSSGIYYYRLLTDGFSETKKMALIK